MAISFPAVAVIMILIALAIGALPLLQRSRANGDRGTLVPALAIAGLIFGSVTLFFALRDTQTGQTVAGNRESSAITPADAGQNPANGKAGSVSSLVNGLEERLEREPDDGKGWLLLAKSYDHLGRDADASAAYERAARLGITDLELESRLLSSTLADAGTSFIKGRVRLSPDAAALVEPMDVVFVIAKAGDGSPMPLAVVRRSAADLPFEFTLDDSSAMVQGSGISSVASLNVTAKISKSGDALNTESSIGATLIGVATTGGDPIELVIAAVADGKQ